MNKKQLTVGWGTGILLCVEWYIIFTHIPNLFNVKPFGIYFVKDNCPLPTPISIFIFFAIPVLIIGGLLIYTLRDNKK